jgi:hypothetical protein
MRTLTLNITAEEFEALENMALENGMSKTAVLRQAIRIYQIISRRMKDGETMSFSGDKERAIQFIGIGL